MTAPARGTRPRNRRQLIVSAAADLFVQHGYARVSMSDIAAAVSIGPSALYRHFRGKRDLLYSAVLDAFAAVRAPLASGEPLESLSVGVLAHRGLGVLWQRESRHLPPAERAVLRAELVAVQRMVASLVPDERSRSRDLLGWAALGALMSVSFHRVRLPAASYAPLLVSIASDVLATDLAVPSSPRSAPVSPESTKERLLAAAVALFATRGYHSVAMEDIGAAVGVAGPSIYHHFPSKVDLLVAAMTAGAAGLNAAAPSDGGLADLLGSYVDYALANQDTLEVMITEVDHLPDEHRIPLRTAQREYVARWLDLMSQTHPTMPYAQARIRVGAALTVVNDVARTPHLATRPGVAAELRAIGARILNLPA